MYNSVLEDTLFFEPGKYWVDNFSRDFSEALADFAIEARNYHPEYEIFVKGSADEPPFLGTMNGNYRFSQVNYFLRNGTDSECLFRKERGVRQFQSLKYDNNDLPFLRAAFLKLKLETDYRDELKVSPQILEGWVTDRHSTSDRNAVIYLYIPNENITVR